MAYTLSSQSTVYVKLDALETDAPSNPFHVLYPFPQILFYLALIKEKTFFF